MGATDVLVAFIAAGGVSTGGVLLWWLKKRSDDRDPVTQEAARLALATQALGVITASRDAVLVDIASLRTERTEDRARIEQLETDRDTDRRRMSEQDRAIAGLRETLRRWTHWYADLVTRWAYHRTQEHAPPAPDDGQPADPTT